MTHWAPASSHRSENLDVVLLDAGATVGSALGAELDAFWRVLSRRRPRPPPATDRPMGGVIALER